jgi:DNA-3-methyladenine glycosylase II
MHVNEAVDAVRAADPAMAEIIAKAGPYSPRPTTGDYFGALARSIMYQQLAGAAATAIHARFVEALGGTVSPRAVLATSSEALRAAGLSNNKTLAIMDLASKSTDGTVPLTELAELDDEEIISRLSAVRGIGRWTAEMFLMFELGRPDVWPVEDFGVRNGWTLMHTLPKMISPKQLQAEGDRFRPYRSIAAWYCWQAVRLLRGAMILPDGAPARARSAKAPASA